MTTTSLPFLKRDLPPPAASVQPAGSARVQARSGLLVAARVLMGFGSLAMLFLGFEFGLTSLVEQRAQATLLTTFQQGIVTTTLDRPTAAIAEGTPVALVDIPRIDLRAVVVEGTTPADLKSGPGHLRGSAVPGEYGNAVLEGHRTTYGAPFGSLRLLARGDRIVVTTGQGAFTYVVSSVRAISTGQQDPLTPTADSRLTLVTSNPEYIASGRLAVFARLMGRPLAVPSRPPVFVAGAELGLGGDPVGLVLLVVFAELLAAAAWLVLRLRRRWPPVVLYTLGAPVLVTLSLLVFASIDLLLPGTL